VQIRLSSDSLVRKGGVAHRLEQTLIKAQKHRENLSAFFPIIHIEHLINHQVLLPCKRSDLKMVLVALCSMHTNIKKVKITIGTVHALLSIVVVGSNAHLTRHRSMDSIVLGVDRYCQSLVLALAEKLGRRAAVLSESPLARQSCQIQIILRIAAFVALLVGGFVGS